MTGKESGIKTVIAKLSIIIYNRFNGARLGHLQGAFAIAADKWIIREGDHQ